MKFFASFVTLVSLACVPSFAHAQSPNTASLVVTVVDQSGGVVAGAHVIATNTATGATRKGTTGAAGSVTLPSLAISGAYTIAVARQGFVSEDVKNVTLRSGETATVLVKVVASGGKSEVTVYGTTQGVRNNPELGS